MKMSSAILPGVKMTFILRPSTSTYWGGDTKTAEAIIHGMNHLGVETKFIVDVVELGPSDFIFLNNTYDDLRPLKTAVSFFGIPYGVIPYYEDHIHYFST
ncbi:MAG: hypothetical protein HY069_04965, partial [Chlamydiia bacterium]|nr:hypothetical protein [Chlamydiia bacterium]